MRMSFLFGMHFDVIFHQFRNSNRKKNVFSKIANIEKGIKYLIKKGINHLDVICLWYHRKRRIPAHPFHHVDHDALCQSANAVRSLNKDCFFPLLQAVLSDVVFLMEKWKYSYIENLTWVQLMPNNKLLRDPYHTFSTSHRTLMLFRRTVPEGGQFCKLCV